MEEDTEVLDWGNEDDEQFQFSDRIQKGASDILESRRGSGDVDDAEDAVSLGGDDDDDMQEYYTYQHQESTTVIVTSTGNKSSGTPKSSTLAHQQQQPQSQSSREIQRENSSNSQKNISNGSPPNPTYSPQRSQSFSKITHALPPKPLVANVPFMHPSHPSIIEATAMSRSRDKSKPNGNGASAGKPISTGDPATATDSSLPPDWEVRHPRSGSRGIYYYNIRTHQSTWSRPVSSSTPSSLTEKSTGGSGGTDRSRGRRESSTSRTPAEPQQPRSAVTVKSPFDTNSAPVRASDLHHHQQQPSEAPVSTALHSGRPPPPDFGSDLVNAQSQGAAPPSSAVALSYEDRHYRPGGGAPTADNNTNATFTSNKRESSDLRHAPQDDFTPPASPERSQSRSRSRSPVPAPPPQHQRGRDPAPRYSRSAHRSGRNSDARGRGQMRESSQRDQVSPGRHWGSPAEHLPPTRRQQRQQQEQQSQQYSSDIDMDSSLVSPMPTFDDTRDRPASRNARGGRAHHRGDHSQNPSQTMREQNQNQNVQTMHNNFAPVPRHRSPPQHIREREPEREREREPERESVQVQLPTSASISDSAPGSAPIAIPSAPVHKQRERASRFDRPAPPTISTSIDPDGSQEQQKQIVPPHSRTSREHDVYVPADINTSQRRDRDRDREQRDRNDLTSSAQISGGDPSHKRPHIPADERNRAPALPALLSERRPSIADAARPERPTSTSSPSSEPHSQSRKKRQPLPPQSLRFRESRTRFDRNPDQIQQSINSVQGPLQDTASLPSGPKDQLQSRPTNSTSNSNSSLPSGPRLQPQPAPPQSARELNPDFARSSRVPPSGPSSNLDRRGDKDRRTSAFVPDTSMDVDVDNLPPPSRAPTSSTRNASDEVPIRAGSGMYADRESPDLPKGPRAMASKVPTSTPSSAPMAAPLPAASTSPTMPFGPHPGGGGGEGRVRDRSPPPHLAANANARKAWAEYGGHRGGLAQPDIGHEWRGEEPQPRPSQGHYPMERSQNRRELLPRKRPHDISRLPPISPYQKVSGPNAVPIGSRKPQFSGAGSMHPGGHFTAPSSHRYRPGSASGPPPGMSGSNMEPVRNNRARGAAPFAKEVYERQPFNPRVSPVDSYRPPEGANTGQRRRSIAETTPPPFERDPPPGDAFMPNAPPPTRSRGDSYYPSEETSRYNGHSPRARTPVMRAWAPREQSPRDLTAHASFTGESDYRVATPPPPSREPSLVSPSWEAPSFSSDRGRRFSDGGRPNRPNSPRVMPIDIDSRPRRQQDVPSDHERDQFNVAEPRRSGSLEGRLSARYDDRFNEGPPRVHGLPPNPSLHRNREAYSPEPRQGRPAPRGRPRSPTGERQESGWVGQRRSVSPPATQSHPRTRMFDESLPSFHPDDTASTQTSRPIRIRRPESTSQYRQDDSMHSDPLSENSHSRERSRDIAESSLSHQQRPVASRRGGSLLDRLSLDHGREPLSDGMSPSLRERVQVPSKRDRDDMMGGDRNSMDAFDGDDLAARKSRRRTGKPRRGKRGGGP